MNQRVLFTGALACGALLTLLSDNPYFGAGILLILATGNWLLHPAPQRPEDTKAPTKEWLDDSASHTLKSTLKLELHHQQTVIVDIEQVKQAIHDAVNQLIREITAKLTRMQVIETLLQDITPDCRIAARNQEKISSLYPMVNQQTDDTRGWPAQTSNHEIDLF
ncbi:MAG: hypothetical protein R3208_08485 [Ketobacteraceae bacterium]|nr:hypothetical protein [Ketobacteraceae bacterium]